MVSEEIGGSHGHVITELAKRVPNFHCTIQDLAESVAEGKERLSKEVAEQATFISHDCCKEQPVKAADAYCFH